MSTAPNPDVASAPDDVDAEVSRVLGLVACGDAEAFADLYRLTAGRVHAVVRKVLRSDDHAAEVTQEVFIQVWAQAARFDPALGGGTGWLMTLARRRAIDRVRAVSRRVALEARVLGPGEETGVDGVWESTRLRLEAGEAAQALRTLSPPQRQVLTLLYLSDQTYTHQQVATLLGVPLGTVKSRIRDGLAVLRRRLITE